MSKAPGIPRTGDDMFSEKTKSSSGLDGRVDSAPTTNETKSLKALLASLYRPRDHFDDEQNHIVGLRGLLVIESFLWVFLTTFAPTTVGGSANPAGPYYQAVLRNVLSVPFWNGNLIYSFFILLSARSISIPFLLDPSRRTIASSIFRRGLRLWWPVAVSLATVMIAFSQLGLDYIQSYKDLTGNESIRVPYQIPNALAYWNAVFNIFWTTRDFAAQAGNTAFPSQTLWTVNVIYSQSYTVFMTMVVIPYTRPSWRVRTALAFILTAWWVQSWAWYSISGLLLADAVMNIDLKGRLRRGIPVWHTSKCLPCWVPSALLCIAGLVMQYLWTDAFPDDANTELVAHTGLYTTGGLNKMPDITEPQARDDIYLIVIGFLLLLEQFDFLQKVFRTRFFRFFGKRSLSYLLTQSIVIYTAGIKLAIYLQVTKRWSSDAANFACLAVCLPLTILMAEFFHHLVDNPSRIFAHGFFDWLRE